MHDQRSSVKSDYLVDPIRRVRDPREGEGVDGRSAGSAGLENSDIEVIGEKWRDVQIGIKKWRAPRNDDDDGGGEDGDVEDDEDDVHDAPFRPSLLPSFFPSFLRRTTRWENPMTTGAESESEGATARREFLWDSVREMQLSR